MHGIRSGSFNGIENGIIVDPLTIAEASDGGGGSGGELASSAEEVMETVMPWSSCFISTAVQQKNEGGWSLWSEIRGRELAILFLLIVLLYVGKLVVGRKNFFPRKSTEKYGILRNGFLS